MGKAQLFGGKRPVDLVGGTRQRAAAQRALVHQVQGIQYTLFIPGHHLGVGQHVVLEGNHLGPLQMGIAGHRPGILVRHLLQGGGEAVNQAGHPVQLGLDVQLHIGVDLIVAAAGGVQLFAHLSYPADQVQLHKGMHILIFRAAGNGAAAPVGQDTFQPLGKGLALPLREQPAPYLHGHMGQTPLNVRLHEPQRFAGVAVEPLHQCILVLVEAAAPQAGLVCVCHGQYPPFLVFTCPCRPAWR